MCVRYKNSAQRFASVGAWFSPFCVHGFFKLIVRSLLLLNAKLNSIKISNFFFALQQKVVEDGHDPKKLRTAAGFRP